MVQRKGLGSPETPWTAGTSLWGGLWGAVGALAPCSSPEPRLGAGYHPRQVIKSIN